MINIRSTRLAIFPLAVILLYSPLTSIAKTFSAKVVRVIDGDTVGLMTVQQIQEYGSMGLMLLKVSKPSDRKQSKQ